MSARFEDLVAGVRGDLAAAAAGWSRDDMPRRDPATFDRLIERAVRETDDPRLADVVQRYRDGEATQSLVVAHSGFNRWLREQAKRLPPIGEPRSGPGRVASHDEATGHRRPTTPRLMRIERE